MSFFIGFIFRRLLRKYGTTSVKTSRHSSSVSLELSEKISFVWEECKSVVMIISRPRENDFELLRLFKVRTKSKVHSLCWPNHQAKRRKPFDYTSERWIMKWRGHQPEESTDACSTFNTCILFAMLTEDQKVWIFTKRMIRWTLIFFAATAGAVWLLNRSTTLFTSRNGFYFPLRDASTSPHIQWGCEGWVAEGEYYERRDPRL